MLILITAIDYVRNFKGSNSYFETNAVRIDI